MPPQASRLTSSARAELRRRDAQTEAILAQLAPPRDSGSPPSLRDILLPRQPEVADPTDAQRAAHEARVRDTQADWGPVRRGVARAADVAGGHVPEFLSGALWGDPTDPDASRANLLGQMLMAGVPLASGLKRGVSRVVNPIKAYHGSPHDFAPEPGAPLGRFKSEAIGTGEGAQAYGHGLYFAEAEGTAGAYRGSLAGVDLVIDGKIVDPMSFSGGQRQLLERVKKDANLTFGDNAVDTLTPHDINETITFALPEISGLDDATRNLAAQLRQSRVGVKPRGHTYEVNIHANPDDFLDWDKPLSQQSERVRNTPMMREMLSEEAAYKERYPSGGLGERLGANVLTTRKEADLAAQGIPGIKYLDQGSRGAGKGTHNWVVFDASTVEILKKYGVSIPVIEGLRHQAAQNDGAVDITGVL